MKVLFLYPSADSQSGFNYGVAGMSAILKASGHETALWQLCEELEPLPTEQEFTERLRRYQPDVVAFSVVTNQWAYGRQLAGWTRKVFAGPIILGGIHALTGAQEILRTGLFDYVFRGECEEALAEFITKLQAGESVKSIRNLAYLDNGKAVINPVRPLPQLRQLIRKDYEMMDFQQLIDVKNGWVGLMASRGCPFSCSYCFNHQMVDAYKQDLQCGFKDLKYIRHQDVDQVIKEIKYLQEHYQRIKMYIFDDDLFTYDKDFVRDFCRAYKKISSLPFVVNCHVGFFGEEVAKSLSEAGCRIVKFGVESGSPEIRQKILNRHMSNDAIAEAIELTERYKMHSSVFLIIGFPYETRVNVQETIDLMAQARPGRYRWTFFFPFPGTKAHEISVQGGFINQDKMSRLRNFTDQSCLDFGGDQDLFLQKVGKIMPWFVNAAAEWPAAPFYRSHVNQILEMDGEQWDQYAKTLLEQDKQMSAEMIKQGLSHYAVKYNRFMGVNSNYFLRET